MPTTQLTITQDWEGWHEGLSARVEARCNESEYGHLFEGEEPEPFVIEREAGDWCRLEHTVPDSKTETITDCEEWMEVPGECEYLTIAFQYSVPAMGPVGFAMLILGIAIVAWRTLR